MWRCLVQLKGRSSRWMEKTHIHILQHQPTKDPPLNSHLCFLCLQHNCMSLPVVYLDPTVDQELASRLTNIITKRQVKCCRRISWQTWRRDISCGSGNVVSSQCYRLTVCPCTGYAHWRPNARQSQHLPLTCLHRGRSVKVCVCVCHCVNTSYWFNFIHCVCCQMNGCVLSCRKTSMSWYIGACTLTGNKQAACIL